MSGLALGNDACRTKSGLENISLGEQPLAPSSPETQQAMAGESSPPGWRWHDTGGN